MGPGARIKHSARAGDALRGERRKDPGRNSHAVRGQAQRAGRDVRAAKPSTLIIAGGRGTRFWPESRVWRPKPLFSIDGRTSLLADTIARVAPITGRGRTFVLVSADQRAIFRRALRGLVPPANLIVEPSARGTAVAIAYGCATIAHRAGPGVVAVMPADHYITPLAAFRRTLSDAIALAATRHAIVVIGVVPDR